VFTACQGDPKTLILDVRSSKDYARKHVMQAYNIRLAASGAALLVCLSRSTCNVPTPLLLKRDSAGTFLSAVLSYRRRQQPVWRATQDYSKNTYDLAWSKDCWWDRPVVVYGAAGLKKDAGGLPGGVRALQATDLRAFYCRALRRGGSCRPPELSALPRGPAGLRRLSGCTPSCAPSPRGTMRSRGECACVF